MLSISFASGDPGWATIIQLTGLALTLITTAIAVHVARIASKIRNLDWIKAQNDAWNAYNALKLVDENIESFKAVDSLIMSRPAPDNLLDDYKIRAVLFSRMNIQERDFRALLYKLIRNYDGFYLVDEIRASVPNAARISSFLAGSGYDPMFVMFYRRVARAFAHNPALTTGDLDVFPILKSIRVDHAAGRTNDHLALLPGEAI
jgi:hypothetical protein